VGVVIDGCPPRVPLSEADVQVELDRRRPGQSDIVTPRKEPDTCKILSGVFQGQTLGTPICMMVANTDTRGSDYDAEVYRPSHADFTYDAKYGIRNHEGGGRASARETIGRVMAGVVARRALQTLLPSCSIEVVAYVESIHEIRAKAETLEKVTRHSVETTPVRCPDPEAAERMISLIEKTKGDSLGGIIGCVARNVPAGWGEPVFDKLEADLAKAMMSIPATKGFEIGSGFLAPTMLGSQHNDAFEMEGNRVTTRTNNSGGIQGGISNGMPITMRIAFKPTATISVPQDTVTSAGEAVTYTGRGRHDVCVLPRAVPIVEAMTWIVLCDHALRQRAIEY